MRPVLYLQVCKTFIAFATDDKNLAKVSIKRKVGHLQIINKPGLHQRCLDDITMLVNKQGDDIANTNFLSQVNSIHNLWSPS